MTLISTPFLAALALLVGATLVGIAPVIKLIQVYEGHHELKQGSAGWLRTVAGWSIIAFWLMTTWFLATIVGDWAVSGDLSGAIYRTWLRLRILLEIAAAFADSD
jgi:hypothetical protein